MVSRLSVLHTPWSVPVFSVSCALSPWCLGFGLDNPHSPVGAQINATRWRGDWSCCCKRIPQSAPEGLFLFEKIFLLNPATPSVQGSTCPLKQPTSPAGQGSIWPNSQLFLAGAHGLCVFTTSSLFPSLRPQATRSLSVLLEPRLAGAVAVNPALSQESCRRPCGHGPGAAVAQFPALVPGTFLP